MKINRNFRQRIRSLYVWVLLGFASTCGISRSQVQATKQDERQPLSILNMNSTHFGRDSRSIGFTNSGNFVIADVKDLSTNTGQIVVWHPQQKRSIAKLPFSKWIDNFGLVLSPDGRWLATDNDPASDAFPHVKAYRTTILKTSDLKVAKIKNYTERESAGGVIFPSNYPNYIFIKAVDIIDRNGQRDYGKAHFDRFNLLTEKVDKSLDYYPAGSLDMLLSSPNRKYFAGLFYSEAFDPYGESDYTPLKNTLEREGFIDIFSPTTGKILWHIESSNKRPIGDPFFFISPTKFVSSDTLFDIPTKTAKPWYAVSATRKCLAAVPGHASYALFMTPQGLELRDWRRKITLRRWPTLTKPGHILFSPDLKMFSFKRDSTIQFWKFDPAWLK